MSEEFATAVNVNIRVRVTLSAIKRAVCLRHGVAAREIESPERTWRLAYPRMIAMTLSRELTSNSLTAIGERYHRDHTTVLHAIRRVAELRAEQPEIDARYDELKMALCVSQDGPVQ